MANEIEKNNGEFIIYPSEHKPPMSMQTPYFFDSSPVVVRFFIEEMTKE